MTKRKLHSLQLNPKEWFHENCQIQIGQIKPSHRQELKEDRQLQENKVEGQAPIYLAPLKVQNRKV